MYCIVKNNNIVTEFGDEVEFGSSSISFFINGKIGRVSYELTPDGITVFSDEVNGTPSERHYILWRLDDAFDFLGIRAHFVNKTP